MLKSDRFFFYLISLMLLSMGCKPGSNPDGNSGSNANFPNGMPSRLKVMSLNIQCPLPTDCGSKKVSALAQFVSGRDVVFLQEAFHGKVYQEIAKQAGYPYYLRGPAAAGSTFSGGAVILSRFPIESSETHTYSKSAVPDNLTNKGLVYAVLKFGKIGTPSGNKEYRLAVASTHLQAPDGDPFQSAREIRGSQALEVNDFIEKKQHENEIPFILGGDFNFAKKGGWNPEPENFEKLFGSSYQGPQATRVSDFCGTQGCVRSNGSNSQDEAREDAENSVDMVWFSTGSGGFSLKPVVYERSSTESDHLSVDIQFEVKF